MPAQQPPRPSAGQPSHSLAPGPVHSGGVHTGGWGTPTPVGATLAPTPTTPQPPQQVQSGSVILVGGDQYTVTVFANGPIANVPAEDTVQASLGPNYAVANVTHPQSNSISFVLGAVNTETVSSATIAAAVGAPAGSIVSVSSPSPAAPPAPTSPPSSASAVTTGLIVTAVVFTAIGWGVNEILSRAFSKKKGNKK